MDAERVPDAELEYDEDLVYYHNGIRFTGIAFDDEGDLGHSEIQYENGLQHGIARDWYANGNLRGESSYWENAKHGYDKEYAPEGSLKRKAVYEYGILIQSEEYDDNGNIVAEYEIAQNSKNYELLGRMRRSMRWPSVDP